jgi:dihydropyrimidinase
MTILIKNGTIITASETVVGDVVIEGEKIKEIGFQLCPGEGTQEIDASGKLVMPGGVDVHTHLTLPMFGTVSSDDHYTGHKAAAFGGTTTAIDFIAHEPIPLQANVKAWHEKADNLAAIDYGFHMNITRLDEAVEKEIPGLVEEGITSVKVFMAYNGRMRLQDGEIFRVLRIAKKYGMLTLLHAENGDVIDILTVEALKAGHTSSEWHALTRPAWGSIEATLRGIALAAQAEAPLYIVHMNTAGEVDQLQYARQRGLPVMGETCPIYLFFNYDQLERADGAKWICSPPVRTAADNLGLWDGLANGILQTIATDHCPFFFDGTKPINYEGKPVAIPGKELGARNFSLTPNGVPGIGDRLPILWTNGVEKGKISPNQFVALTATNPAKIFGLYPRKGTIMPGSDADIAIWDPKKQMKYGVQASHHRTDYNLFEGWELTGFPEKVFLRGKLIVDGEDWLGEAGTGKYLYREPFAPIL